MDELGYIVNKYGLDTSQRNPIEIPDTGRTTLAALFSELKYKVGAEIGVERGIYSEVMCKANPGVKLFCVDAWQTYSGYRDHTDINKLGLIYEEAIKRLARYNVEYIKRSSMDALVLIEDGSLDFVYIDANHEWPYVTQDIYYWSKKVRPGGIVSGHDFYESTRTDSKCQVKHAVIGYTNAFRVRPWFVLGLKAKIPGLIRDKSRSWFWVKPE
jgi:hypothetical protein